MEHRCGTRHPVDILVQVRSHGGTIASTARLRSISVSGGFLETVVALQPLARVLLRFAGAKGASGTRWDGHVVRRTAEGVGIEWEADMGALLHRLIKPPCVPATTPRRARSRD